MRQYCTSTICTQNNFAIESASTKTNYIMVRIKNFYGDTTLPYGDLDQYFRTDGFGVPVGSLSYTEDITGANPQRLFARNDQGSAEWRDTPSITPFGANAPAEVAWWTDAYTNQTQLNHGFQTGAGPVSLNGIEGSKRIGGNHIYANLTGTQLKTALEEQGYTSIPDRLTPIGMIEGICRVYGQPWVGNRVNPNDQTDEDLKYYLVVRLTTNFMTWASSYQISPADNPGILKYNTINFQEFDSSLFDIKDWAISRNWNTTLPRGNINNPNLIDGYQISTLTEFRQLYEVMNQGTAPTGSPPTGGTGNLGEAGNGYVDRIFELTGDIALTPTGSFTATINNASVIVNDFEMLYDFTNEGTPQQAIVRVQPGSDPEVIEYVMPEGSFVKILSTTGKFVWYETYEQIQHVASIYTYPPFADGETGVGEKWSLNTEEAIPCAINNLPTKQLETVSELTTNWISTNVETNGNQYRFLHYRNNTYETLPMPDWASQRFPGLRMINQNVVGSYTITENSISTSIESTLQNTTNKLSVYTYAQIATNRELCCPPLDTSPPFDSSPIGLSTTNLNPDMYIDGLINVRSITANHPINKFYSTAGLSNENLPVTDKLELLFGDTKYKLLLGDTDPTLL